jgi:hypothetical protein
LGDQLDSGGTLVVTGSEFDDLHGGPGGKSGGASGLPIFVAGAGGRAVGIAHFGEALTLDSSTIAHLLGGPGGTGGDSGTRGFLGGDGGQGGAANGVRAVEATGATIIDSTSTDNVGGPGGSGGSPNGEGGVGGDGVGLHLLGGLEHKVTHATVTASHAGLTAPNPSNASPTPVGAGLQVDDPVQGGTTTLAASLLDNIASGATNCAITAGTVADPGYNAMSDNTCGAAPTDLVDPTLGAQLDALGANGGPTRTIALHPTSPATTLVDASVTATAVNANGYCAGPFALDQRGQTRPGGTDPNKCAAGAFEPQFSPSTGGGGSAGGGTVTPGNPGGGVCIQPGWWERHRHHHHHHGRHHYHHHRHHRSFDCFS